MVLGLWREGLEGTGRDVSPSDFMVFLCRSWCRLLAKMNTYNQETRNAFEAILAWLNQWACARSFGLGSRLPWDPSFLVESLSDSTIYMSYYTVAHLLQGEHIYPSI